MKPKGQIFVKWSPVLPPRSHKTEHFLHSWCPQHIPSHHSLYLHSPNQVSYLSITSLLFFFFFGFNHKDHLQMIWVGFSCFYILYEYMYSLVAGFFYSIFCLWNLFVLLLIALVHLFLSITPLHKCHCMKSRQVSYIAFYW